MSLRFASCLVVFTSQAMLRTMQVYALVHAVTPRRLRRCCQDSAEVQAPVLEAPLALPPPCGLRDQRHVPRIRCSPARRQVIRSALR
jgi:hypothetical protein